MFCGHPTLTYIDKVFGELVLNLIGLGNSKKGIKNTQVGYPAAPRISSLLLLPLGPDRVRRVPPRRTHLSMRKHTSGKVACQYWFIISGIDYQGVLQIS